MLGDVKVDESKLSITDRTQALVDVSGSTGQRGRVAKR